MVARVALMRMTAALLAIRLSLRRSSLLLLSGGSLAIPLLARFPCSSDFFLLREDLFVSFVAESKQLRWTAKVKGRAHSHRRSRLHP